MEMPISLYNYTQRLATKEVIDFDKPMSAMAVDLNMKEIPGNVLTHAPQHLKNIFDIVAFTYKMFTCKGHLADAFLVRKGYLLPKEVEAEGLKTGYMLVVLLQEDVFQEHFPTVVKTALALNHGYLYDEALWGMPFSEIEESLENFNATLGFGTGKKRKFKNETKIGNLKCLSDFDASIDEYHLYQHQNRNENIFAKDLIGKDMLDAWQERAKLLTPKFLYECSRRIVPQYKEVMRLACLISNNLVAEMLPDEKATFRKVINILNRLPPNDPMTEMYAQQVNQLTWDNIMARSEAGVSLDLRNTVSWKLRSTHLMEQTHFYQNQFYELAPTDINTSAYDMTQDERDRTEYYMFQVASGRYKGPSNSDEPALYPTLDLLQTIFKALAKSHTDGQVSRLYLDKKFGSFLMGTYNDLMYGDVTVMSEARRLQYSAIPEITDNIFPGGNLNASRDGIARKHQVLCGRMFHDVEPHQDAMASQLLEMAITTGVCHLSVELYTFLLANILGFTTKCEKPHIVLDGPTGAGKSFVAKVNQMIAQGSGTSFENKYACADEHYSTTRAFTVSAANPYQTVLGQRLVEEWRSGEGKTNPFLSNTTLESVTLKNLYDHGKSVNQRCQIKKNRNGEEKITRGLDYALDDRSAIILANGFKVCSSVKNRFIIFHIPDLNVRVTVKDPKDLQSALSDKNIPQFFLLMRHLIADEINREHLNMSLKLYDSSEDMDCREIHLTMERLQDVLEDMGFNSRDIMTPRKRLQVVNFAKIIAHWRAVTEVYGGVHFDCKIEPRDPEESHEDYNNRVITKMTRHLASLTPLQKAKRQSARYVVDPVDILSAATLIVQLTEPDRQLMKVICSHLVNPSDCEEIEPWKEQFLVIDNINISTICEELQRQKMKVLDESLGGLLAKLEDKYVKNRVPCVVRKSDGGAINRSKEKKYQLFSLYVNAEYAAKLYAQEQSDTMKECVKMFTDHMLQVTMGNVQCQWRSSTGQIVAHTGYIQLEIPKHLKKAFDFIYHLPGKKRLVDSCNASESSGGYTVAVHPDYGQARLRTLQTLLVQKLKSEGGVDICQNGYIELSVENTGIFGESCKQMVRDVCEGWDMNPMLVSQIHGKWHVHVNIFDRKYDNQQDVKEWRKVILSGHLEKGIFARKGYFIVSAHKIGHMKEIEKKTSIDTSRNMPIFGRDRAKKTLFVHISVLGDMSPLQGIVEDKSNLGKTWVEKCLCKNMTNFSTVMVFDREKVYETQDVLDSISFVNVQDVAFRRYDGHLPDFKTTESADMRRADDGFKSTIENLTRYRVGDGFESFHPRHRERKLAFKNLLATGKVADLLKLHKTSKQQNAKILFRKDLEVGIGEVIDKVSTMYKPIAKLEELEPYPEPLRQQMNGNNQKVEEGEDTHGGSQTRQKDDIDSCEEGDGTHGGSQTRQRDDTDSCEEGYDTKGESQKRKRDETHSGGNKKIRPSSLEQ